jgi:hypothetical protein
MVSELVSLMIALAWSALMGPAFIIQPNNASGRSDNLKWDAEYTLIVSDWYASLPLILKLPR